MRAADEEQVLPSGLLCIGVHRSDQRNLEPGQGAIFCVDEVAMFTTRHVVRRLAALIAG